jgi:hypothetical protein
MKMTTTTLFRNFAGAMLAATLCLTASAQTTIPPSMLLPDNPVAHGAYPNSATIDYSPFCGGGGGGVGCQLTAVVIDGGQAGPAPLLTVNDQVSGWVTVPLPAPTHSMPDVAIGNDLLAPGNYIAGVTVTMWSGAGYDVYLLLYRIMGAGSGLSVVGPYATYNISGTAMAVQEPSHIDIIGEYSTPFMGMPQADKFAVTWAEAASPGPVNIMGYYGSLNGFFPPTTQVIASGTFNSPDVAAVERAGAGGFEDWALFSYTDILGGYTNLYYQEWQMNPGAPPSPAISIGYDNYAIGTWYSLDRIDAIDNFALNAPGSGSAYYDVVAQVYTWPSGVDIMQYNNLTSGPVTYPLAPGAGFGSYVPVVAWGPGPRYSVGYFREDNVGANPAYYTTSVDWPSGSVTLPGDAYQVNTIPYTVGWIPDPRYGITLSTTCNVDMTTPVGTQQMFAAWQNNANIYSKYTNTFPYVYKHNTQTAATTTTTWTISPNPASDYAVLSAPSGFDVKSKATYQVQDMAGKTLLRSNIGNSAERIDISRLAAGMYIVNINGGNAPSVSLKLVKD